MIHCCRRAELCQHSSPWAQIWTVALSYGRKSLAVGISNEELHVCRALRLIKFWGVYNFIYFPDNSDMGREVLGDVQRTSGARTENWDCQLSISYPFHFFSDSSDSSTGVRMENELSYTSVQGVLCCGKDVGRVIWADSLRHLCWHLFHTVMILHFFLPCVSTPTCSLKQRLCFLAVECNPRIRGH